jgi:hypothetical protein
MTVLMPGAGPPPTRIASVPADGTVESLPVKGMTRMEGSLYGFRPLPTRFSKRGEAVELGEPKGCREHEWHVATPE